jgi:hypothetical protein
MHRSPYLHTHQIKWRITDLFLFFPAKGTRKPTPSPTPDGSVSPTAPLTGHTGAPTHEFPVPLHLAITQPPLSALVRIGNTLTALKDEITNGWQPCSTQHGLLVAAAVWRGLQCRAHCLSNCLCNLSFPDSICIYSTCIGFILHACSMPCSFNAFRPSDT